MRSQQPQGVASRYTPANTTQWAGSTKAPDSTPEAFANRSLDYTEGGLLTIMVYASTDRNNNPRRTTDFVSARHANAWPLKDFSPEKQQEIADLVARPRPPHRWIYFGAQGGGRALASTESRAWWEWHWQRGRDPEKARAKMPRALRERVIARDGLVCGICGQEVEPHDVHIDHIHPVAQGGTDDLSNLQVAHSRCNLLKGAKV